MKKWTGIILSAVMVLGMSVTALAAESPSASGATAVDKDGNAVEVTAVDISSNPESNVADKMTELKTGEEVVEETKNEDGTVTKTVIKNVIKAVLEVNAAGASETNPITVTFSVDGITSDSNVYAMHLTAKGWEKLNGKAGSGTVTLTFTSFSPVIIYEEVRETTTENPGTTNPGTTNPGTTKPTTQTPSSTKPTSTTNTGKSPYTGEAGVAGVILLAVLCGGAVLLLNLKKKAA